MGIARACLIIAGCALAIAATARAGRADPAPALPALMSAATLETGELSRVRGTGFEMAVPSQAAARVRLWDELPPRSARPRSTDAGFGAGTLAIRVGTSRR